MRLLRLSSLLGLLTTPSLLPHLVRAQSSVSAYIATESPLAQAGLLANIGSSGSKSSGAKPGVVIASPSTNNPDYLYTWTRDSSLVFKALIDQYTQNLAGASGSAAASIRSLIDEFVQAEATLQQVSNPSGTVSTGGLGEPKFNIDETAFTGAWGRPQRGEPFYKANTSLV